jgi:hypothetical protein
MKYKQVLAFVSITLGTGLMTLSVSPSRATPSVIQIDPSFTPDNSIATQEQLSIAYSEWQDSAHADTYDNGMGANTTCARCKSPKNWDPSQQLAQQEALNCFACKRVPGAERPELLSGVSVPEEEWANIGCEICHEPVEDSFYTAISYWDGQTGQYLQVENPNELCAKCHEGRHGFEVMEEQEQSPAHNGWECTLCHGAHGKSVACTDCHDPNVGAGVDDHRTHLNVNCTACHDAGALTIWKDPDPLSGHYDEFITRRFAHTLTSWPSHNLELEVLCERCHHYPLGRTPRPQIADEVGCQVCHAEGAGMFWCAYFTRNPNPLETEFLTDPYDEK